MDIRTATPVDGQAIAAFDCFGGDRPAAIEAGRCLVAEMDGRLAGYVVFQRRALIGRDFVEFLVVDESFRRAGVAVALLRAVESRLEGGRLFISTGASNAPMQSLLGKGGWSAAGQIEGVNTDGSAELFFYRDLP